MIKLNLRLFGDVTPITVTSTLGMSPTMKTFYDTTLLENSREEDVFEQFGVKTPIKGNTVEWRKFNTFAPALTPLTEGVVPTGKTFGMTNITGTIGQYGDYTAISDRLELESYDDVIYGASVEMGAAAGKTRLILRRNALGGGTNVFYGSTVSGGTATQATARHQLDNTAVMTPALIKKCRTAMKKNNVPTIKGKYVCIIHPSVAEDLTNSQAWIEYHKYNAPEEIFKGEIGELHGVVFIESNACQILRGDDLASNSRTLLVNDASNIAAGAVTTIAFDGGTVAAHALKGRLVVVGGYKFEVTDNTASALTVKSVTTTSAIADNSVIYPGEGGAGGVAVYFSYMLGAGAFGIIDPEGEGLELIVKTKEQIGGPLEQFGTIGYKMCDGTKILYEERLLRIETGSTYGSDDLAN